MGSQEVGVLVWVGGAGTCGTSGESDCQEVGSRLRREP